MSYVLLTIFAVTGMIVWSCVIVWSVTWLLLTVKDLLTDL